MEGKEEMLPCPLSDTESGGSYVSSSLIEEVTDTTETSPRTLREAKGEGLVGECIDDKHPTLSGRVLVRWESDEEQVERWVPTLQQVPVRVHDRVLLMRPANFDEPVVTGVLDGFSRRTEPNRDTAASLDLKRDEAVRIASENGQGLVEIFQDKDGDAVVRLLDEDVNLEVPGKLRMKASRIEMEAVEGPVEIEASDDVNVRGEVINLN